MFTMLIAALLQPAEQVPDAAQQPITSAYLGVWAPAATDCGANGKPQQITIGRRRIDYYESTGYLQQAQLSHIETIPVIRGRFAFAGELRFWDQVVELRLRAGKLFIKSGPLDADLDEIEPGRPWVRCPAG